MNFNESVYASGWDATSAMGGWMRLGNRVNEGYAELSVCLYLPGGRVACAFGKPSISHNDAFDAGGLRYRVDEPFAGVTMAYDGEVFVLDDPSLLRDPRRMFARRLGRRHRCGSVRAGVSPMHGGEAMVPEHERSCTTDWTSPAGTSTSTPR